MPETDVFRYGKSGLCQFRFTEIGVEPNGLCLKLFVDERHD
jgi:hypothetical protein